MNEPLHIFHPMIARAMTAYNRTPNFGDNISRQLASLIGDLQSMGEREDEVRRICVAVQCSLLPQKFMPALHELAHQVVSLLGGIEQLKAISTLRHI